MTRAKIEETIVPKMNGRAPNSPATGSQELPLKKWNPNFCQASAERCRSSARMSPTTASTVSAASRTNPLKPESRLNSDRFQADALCAVFTREILGDSELPIWFVDVRANACPCDRSSGIRLSGAAPIGLTLPSLPRCFGAASSPGYSKAVSAFVKGRWISSRRLVDRRPPIFRSLRINHIELQTVQIRFNLPRVFNGFLDQTRIVLQYPFHPSSTPVGELCECVSPQPPIGVNPILDDVSR